MACHDPCYWRFITFQLGLVHHPLCNCCELGQVVNQKQNAGASGTNNLACENRPGDGNSKPGLKLHEGTIPLNKLWEGVADLIPHEDKLKVRSQSTGWSAGMADLVPYAYKLKYNPNQLNTDLIPHEDYLKGKIPINTVVRGSRGFDPL